MEDESWRVNVRDTTEFSKIVPDEKEISGSENKEKNSPPLIVPSKNSEENIIIEERLKKLTQKFTKNFSWINYIILAFIVWIGIAIRTLNINGLKDINTGDWTLGPDLDPFLFLRWAEYIAENGKLFVIDTFRNVPLGYNTSGESQLLSYMIAYFYKSLNLLPSFIQSMLPGSPSEITVTYAAILFPVFMFALTVIAFYFLTKEFFEGKFDNKNYPGIIALIASFLLTISTSLLPRTIAGIPEKESAAFLFIFLSLYFFLVSFKMKSNKKSITYALLAGISTGILALLWGGVTFVLLMVGLAFLGAYFVGTIGKRRFISYLVWTITFLLVSNLFSTRSTLLGFITSISSAPIVFGLILSVANLFLYDKIKKIKYVKMMQEYWKLSREVSVFIFVGIISFLAVIIYSTIIDPGFLSEKINSLFNNLIRPLDTTRFSRTVAENRQPFFVGEWKGFFGPNFANIPILFYLFMAGAITLFWNMIRKLKKKHKVYFTISFALLIFLMVFSRYSSGGSLNGVNNTSLFLYGFGFFSFIIYGSYLLYLYGKDKNLESMKFDFSYLLLISMFVISLLAARSGVRFMMVLAPAASIMAAYLLIYTYSVPYRKKEGNLKLIFWAIFGLILISTIYVGSTYYSVSKDQAISFQPGGYQFQWQKAMSWVRDNTSQNAVFSHWWDYGYWIQSLGERATVLDGGNVIVYWNHLLGRHVLTGTDDQEALVFLKTHEATHLLIDSTDIGKYSAYSSIGGDENNDRFSFIPSFFLDESLSQETRNGFTYVYTGGSNLDEDIIFEHNGTIERLSVENTGLVGFFIEKNANGRFNQPSAVFIQNGRQIQLPVKYIHYEGELHEFESGIESGIYMVETLNPDQGGITRNREGAVMYLSKRTINSLLVRKYLFGEEGNFKLVHEQPSPIVESLESQGYEVNGISYFQGSFLGPIKIWEIKYPGKIESNPDYLVKEYPDSRLI